MEMDFCSECKINQVQIVKRGLCERCYGRLRQRGELDGIGPNQHKTSISKETEKKYEALAEIEFIKHYFKHEKWRYHPAMFYLGGEKYTPDFYDEETGAFIEVVGTRQAYHGNKPKYDLFKQFYPTLLFEIRYQNGELLDEENLAWAENGC